jgi:hypothetical protein
VLKIPLTLVILAIACMNGAAFAAAAEPKPGEAAKADKARSKPLQRCDQLSDKAELDCLHKARVGIVEARRTREASAAAK